MKKSTALKIAWLLSGIWHAQISNSQTNFSNLQNSETRIADSLYLQGEWKAAIPAYEVALKKNSSNSLAWNRLGYSYQNTGEYSKALGSYQHSLASQPFPQLKTVVQSRISRTYSLMQKKSDALIWLDSATHNGYANLREMDTLQDYNAIRNEDDFKEFYKRAYNTAFPCMSDLRTRQFDFWVGEWDVYQNGNTKTIVGNSRVDIASGGCMILENWTSMVGAHNGKSMNYFDPQKGKWEQVWVGSEGGPQIVHRFVNGEYKEDAMRFEFEGSDNTGKYKGRFIFYNLGKDKVRQFSEQSYDDGKTWQTNYDFIYIRKK